MTAIKVSRILHAGYVFEAGQSEYESSPTRIAFDPIFENPFSLNCFAFPDVTFDLTQIRKLSFDAVFISHFHEDHCSLTSLNELNRDTPIYMYCVHDEMFVWLRELGFKNVCSLQLNTPVKAGAFVITPRRALDEFVDCIFHIQSGELNILNVVDAWIDLDTLKLLEATSSWDLIMWPFQTMREVEVIAPRRAAPAAIDVPPEWITQLRTLRPKRIIASSCQFIQESWSWYREVYFPIPYQSFQNEVEAKVPGALVMRLNPGKSLRLTRDSCEQAEALQWILPVGPQDVDYVYNSNLKAPATSEMAKRFSPLSREQSQQVDEFCRNGLLSRLRSLDPPEQNYFRVPRYWRLLVYDHEGVARTYDYILENGVPSECAELSKPESQRPLGWMTEVPISKLHSAIFCGESWTSMYMRINDIKFSDAIESQIGSVDIFEDPLVRALFNGVFGAYQKRQLQTLQLKSLHSWLAVDRIKKI